MAIKKQMNKNSKRILIRSVSSRRYQKNWSDAPVNKAFYFFAGIDIKDMFRMIGAHPSYKLNTIKRSVSKGEAAASLVLQWAPKGLYCCGRLRRLALFAIQVSGPERVRCRNDLSVLRQPQAVAPVKPGSALGFQHRFCPRHVTKGTGPHDLEPLLQGQLGARTNSCHYIVQSPIRDRSCAGRIDCLIPTAPITRCIEGHDSVQARFAARGQRRRARATTCFIRQHFASRNYRGTWREVYVKHGPIATPIISVVTGPDLFVSVESHCTFSNLAKLAIGKKQSVRYFLVIYLFFAACMHSHPNIAYILVIRHGTVYSFQSKHRFVYFEKEVSEIRGRQKGEHEKSAHQWKV